MEEEVKLYYCGFIEEEKEIKLEELSDCHFRKPHSVLTPLLVSCSCKIFQTTLLALTKKYLYYTHGNTLMRHSLVSSLKKFKTEFNDYTDDEILNTEKTGNQQIKKLHAGTDFVAILIEGKDACEALVVCEDGNSFTIQMDVGVEEFVYGKKFGLLRTTDNKLTQIDAKFSGDENIDMSPLRLPPNTSVRSMSCGKEHAIVLSTDHQIFAVGGASRGQMGNGGTDSMAELTAVEMLEMLKIQEVSAGGWHCLVLSGEGDLYGWGWNESGQVGSLPPSINGDDDGKESGDKAGGSSGKTSCEKTVSKLLFLPQLVAAPIDETFISISTGSRHSAAVTSSGVLYTWGWNGYGQLCHGDQYTRFTPTRVESFQGGKKMNVQCGSWATLVCVAS